MKTVELYKKISSILAPLAEENIAYEDSFLGNDAKGLFIMPTSDQNNADLKGITDNAAKTDESIISPQKKRAQTADCAENQNADMYSINSINSENFMNAEINKSPNENNSQKSNNPGKDDIFIPDSTEFCATKTKSDTEKEEQHPQKNADKQILIVNENTALNHDFAAQQEQKLNKDTTFGNANAFVRNGFSGKEKQKAADKDYRQQQKSLTNQFDICSHEAKIILAHIFNCSLNSVFLQKDPDEEQITEAIRIAEIRRSHYPLQYILQEAWFMGRRFTVNENVLIPRADTEPMTEEIIRLLQNKNKALIADICCGSGAIGISVAAATAAFHTQVIGTDISDKALDIARQNAEGLDNISFLQGDLCAPLRSFAQKFDMIVCNPPYVTAEEMQNLQAEVRFEPNLALYGGKDGLDFYRRLAKETPALLKANGYLVLEIGCEQKDDVCRLLCQNGFHIEKTLTDLTGKDRSIFAIKNPL